ncbi:MAG: hypothetical protein KI791_21400 [Cyclobacteriaceae bacterium]|nr:hypothetical protein [Cyclobacteriaceae bacterium SS2]
MRLDELHRTDKKDKKIRKVLSIVATIVTAFIIVSLISVLTFDDQEYLESIKMIEVSGIVTEKVDQSWNHGTKLLKVSNGQEKVTLDITRNVWVRHQHFEENDNYLNPLWDYVNEGDSLTKQTDSWIISIKKPELNWREFKLSMGQNQ